MAQYRVTIRYGRPAHQYHVVDLEADTLADALHQAADALPPGAEETGDLVELRRQTDPDQREYVPE